MIASLQMYDWPELQEHYVVYWNAIRKYLQKAGMDAPPSLARHSDEAEPWLRPDLVLSLTCSMPYRLSLSDKVQIVGTPDYNVADCPAGFYQSVLVAHKNDRREQFSDFRNASFACNSEYSQSGYAAAYFHAAASGFRFENIIESGSHRSSGMLVAKRDAKIASIDAVSWRYMQRYDRFTDELRVVGLTEPTPGLPYITAAGNEPKLIYDAVGKAIRELPGETSEVLGIKQLVYISPGDYMALPTPQD